MIAKIRVPAEAVSAQNIAASVVQLPQSFDSSVLALNSTLIAGISSHLLIVLLQRRQILPRFTELALLHPLTHVPMYKRTLRVHQVELVIQVGPRLRNCRGIRQHADAAIDLGELRARHGLWWLIVDTDLEAGGAPLDQIEGLLSFEGRGCLRSVMGYDVAAVEECDSHVSALAGVADNHLVLRLEALEGEILCAEGFVGGALGGDDGCVGDEWEVDSGERNEIGLEFGDIDVDGTFEAEGGGDGGDDLSDEAVEVGVLWAGNVEVALADVVDGFVVDEKGAVAVLEGGMG